MKGERSGTLSDVLLTSLTLELPHRGITVQFDRTKVVVVDRQRQLDAKVANEVLNFIEAARDALTEHFKESISGSRVRRGSTP